MSKKKILTPLFLIIVLLIFYFVYKSATQSIKPVVLNDVPEQKVLEVVELKTQKDFKMIGQEIFQGTGFEPGFNFRISIAGTKFGTELVSQYGDTHYVGYLDLVNNSTSTKTFSGKMLDKTDKIVEGLFNIFQKKCTLPSGTNVPFTVDIKVATETLSGCATIVSK